jgi:hypothetical protein
LQRAARSCSAKFIGSEEFVDTLERRQDSSTTSRGGSSKSDDDATRERHASAEQLGYWLKVFGDVPIVEPDEDDQKSPSPPADVIPKSKPAVAGSRRPPRSRKPRLSDDSKPVGNVGGEELAYWMDVFSEDRSGSASLASAEELRLSDLENWLKEFEANEAKAADKRK